ncbi:MAG: ABC transporter ATP-binding protein [Blastocatellia bacterium AA13]|nr:MAG: ABC transporter ATP-binding protein [Blastocatellia bacterium AA13]
MKLLSFMMKYSPGLVITALIAGTISGASSTGLLAVINSSLRRSEPATATLILSFIGLCLIVPLSRIISEVVLIRLGQGALFDLRTQLRRQILAVPLRQLEKLGSHRLMAALTDDVPAITNIVTVIPVLCINAAVAIGCLLFLGWLSWQMLTAVLVFIAVGIATYQIPIFKAMARFKLAREQADKLFRHLRALTDGIKELKLHSHRRAAFSEMFDSTAGTVRGHNVSGLTIYTVASSWGQLLVFVVIGMLLFAVPVWKETTAQSLTGYTLVLLFLMTPLQVIMNSLPGIGRANVALNNVNELGLTLTKYSSADEISNTQESPANWRSLDIIGVTHAYQIEGEESKFTLGPIDMTLYPGEVVFVIGGNGSGKTTLAKLMSGLYIPESGEIHLDGAPVTSRNRERYRHLFSAVFSDFYLFESLLGLETPGLDDNAADYIRQLGLSHKVEVKDGKLSTTELSLGQRKRLALLTAYLEDRPIYLFDEWAADQDPIFKRVFYYQILPELKARGKTVIVISHDDRYYHVGDRIIKLDYGRIEYDRPVGGEEEVTREVYMPLAN